MKRVQHPGRVRDGGEQRGGVAAERVKCRHRDVLTPGLVAAGNPPRQHRSAASLDDIQQPRRVTECDDSGREPGPRRGGRGQERGLVHTDRMHPGQALRVVDQRVAVVADRRHHGAPPDTELGRHRRDGVPVLPDPPTRLTPSALGPRHPRPDRLARLCPRPFRAARFVAAPHPLHPHQRHRPTGRGQITHPTRPPVMQLRSNPAGPAPAPPGEGLHRLLHLAVVLRHGQHPEPGQAEHGRRRGTVVMHLGPPAIDGVRHLDREVPGLPHSTTRELRRGAITTLH